MLRGNLYRHRKRKRQVCDRNFARNLNYTESWNYYSDYVKHIKPL